MQRDRLRYALDQYHDRLGRARHDQGCHRRGYRHEQRRCQHGANHPDRCRCGQHDAAPGADRQYGVRIAMRLWLIPLLAVFLIAAEKTKPPAKDAIDKMTKEKDGYKFTRTIRKCEFIVYGKTQEQAINEMRDRMEASKRKSC